MLTRPRRCWRTETAAELINIMDEKVRIVGRYKYLGAELNIRLDWGTTTEAVYKEWMEFISF